MMTARTGATRGDRRPTMKRDVGAVNAVSNGRVVVLGARPAGCGAVRRPQESGYRGRGSYEADAHVGGLAVGGNDRSGRR